MKKILSMFIILAYMVCMIPVSAEDIQSTAAQLTNVTVADADLFPAFSPDVFSYDVFVSDTDMDLPELSINCESGSSYEAISLAENLGDKTVIKVSKDGFEDGVYTFIYRAPYESNTDLGEQSVLISQDIVLQFSAQNSPYSEHRYFASKYGCNYAKTNGSDITLQEYDFGEKNPNPFAPIYISFYQTHELLKQDTQLKIYIADDGYEWERTTATWKNVLTDGNLTYNKDNYVTYTFYKDTQKGYHNIDVSALVKPKLLSGVKKFTILIETQYPDGASGTINWMYYLSHASSTYASKIYYSTIMESTDSSLKSVDVGTGIIDKKFSSDVFEYNIGIKDDETPVLKYVLSNSHANVEYTPAEKIGDTAIVKVTPQSKNGKKSEYKFNFVSYEDAGISEDGKLESAGIRFSKDSLEASDKISVIADVKNNNIAKKTATVVSAIKNNDALEYINIYSEEVVPGNTPVETEVATPSSVTNVKVEGYIFDKEEKTVLADKGAIGNTAFTSTVTSAEKNLEYKVLETEGKVKFFGKGTPNTNYVFFVTYPEKDYADLTIGNMTSVLAAFDVVKTNDSGIWECNVKVPTGTEYYSAYVYDGAEVSEPVEFLYVSTELKTSTLDTIYNVIYDDADADDIKAALKESLGLSVEENKNDEILGISASFEDGVTETAVVNALYNLVIENSEEKPEVSGTADLAEFAVLYNKAITIAKLNAGKSIPVLTLINDLEYTDLVSLYDSLAEFRKDSVNHTLINKDISNNSELYNLIKTNILLDIISNPENVAVSEDTIDAYGKYLGLDMSSYKKVTSKTKMIQELVNKGPYTTKTALDTEFDSLIKKYTKASSGGSGGSGGGGGGSSSSVSGNIADSSTSVSEPVYADEFEPKEEPAKKVFDDIEVSDWTYESTSYLSEKGIITGVGDGKYEPTRSVSREEFAKIICLAFNISDSEADVNFTDVSADAWYYQYVKNVVASGAVLGVSDTEFGTGNGLRRQDAALILFRVLSLTAKESEAFADDAAIADYAKEAVYTLKEMGVLNGTGDGKFDPERTVTRGECAKIIYELIKE